MVEKPVYAMASSNGSFVRGGVEVGGDSGIDCLTCELQGRMQ